LSQPRQHQVIFSAALTWHQIAVERFPAVRGNDAASAIVAVFR
jgi:hypothetical protein